MIVYGAPGVTGKPIELRPASSAVLAATAIALPWSATGPQANHWSNPRAKSPFGTRLWVDPASV